MRLTRAIRLHKWRTIAVVVVLAAGAGVGIWLTTGSSGADYELTSAATGTVQQSVSATSTIEAVNQADVDFSTAGKVATVNVVVGQQVAAGAVLGTLDPSTLQATVAQDEASVATDESKLSSDQSGQSVQTANQAITTAEQQVTLQNQQITADQTAITNDQTNLTATQASNAVSLAQSQNSLTDAQTKLSTDETTVSTDQTNADDLSAAESAENVDCGGLCGWLHQQFTLEMRPEEFENVTPEDAVALVRRKIDELYRQKEIEFPVAVGMTNFMAEGPGGGGERYNREGLIRWANDRFQVTLPIEEVKDRPRNEIENLLKESSRRFFVNGELIEKTEEYLDQAYPDRESHPRTAGSQNGETGRNRSWANSRSGPKTSSACRSIRASWSRWTITAVRERVLHAYDTRYRPELYQVERALILEVLDTAWKDHLYYMDHLRPASGWSVMPNWTRRSSTSARAQDLLAMWDRVAQQTTSAIFRIEKESPGFVGSLWQITAVSHAEGLPMTSEPAASDGQPEGTGPTVAVVEPIHNRLPKVGRNDPCPCGSGKKYKKCCGANA